MGENAWKYSWKILKKRHYLELDVDGTIIIKQIISKQAGRMWTEFICPEQKAMAGRVIAVINDRALYNTGNFLTSK